MKERIIMPSVYMAGDSTMADYPVSSYPQTGWGQILKSFAMPEVKVCNCARGGRSSKSFREEKLWDLILDRLLPGDFIIIQFGHNDGHTGPENQYRFTDPETSFPEYLKIYLSDAGKKGAVPILVTPTPSCLFHEGKAVNKKRLSRYAAAVRKTAAATGTALIDMNAGLLEKLTLLGEEKASRLYMNLPPGEFLNFPDGKNDNVHFSYAGAELAAVEFIELLKKQNLPAADLFSHGGFPAKERQAETTHSH